MDAAQIDELVRLDHAHVWHPFTPMRQWREQEPIIIERAEGDWLIDVRGKRYLDGVSSLWCNVHGHRAPELDQAVRDQLGQVAHSTMLGLASVPSIRLAAKLCELAPGPLSQVFYSDAGATSTEIAFKMAAGYFFHARGEQRDVFVGISGAYHGDTLGSMSVGYSELFHRPFEQLVFRCAWAPAPDVSHSEAWQAKAADRSTDRKWSLEDLELCDAVRDDSLAALDQLLSELGGRVAAVVVEPLVQGAAGMVMQPPGYLKGVASLARKHDTLLVADEVATGFGRTGRMFACEHEQVEPDILCVGKGLTGGYLPLAATLCTATVEQAFCGDITEHKTLYHGHTYTGNPLACAVALASLDRFEDRDVLTDVREKAERLAQKLSILRDAAAFPQVRDVRQRGLMVGIELSADGSASTGFDPSRRLGHEVCDRCRAAGVIVRPLGNVVVLVPPLGMAEENLDHVVDVVVAEIGKLS